MAGPLNAKVILAKCSKTRKAFGIRIEQRGREWVRTWAFPIDERKAKREGYAADSTVSLGGAADGYPGCPHCGDQGIALDNDCDKISCMGGAVRDGGTIKLTCPWCGKTDEYGAAEGGLDVKGGGY